MCKRKDLEGYFASLGITPEELVACEEPIQALADGVSNHTLKLVLQEVNTNCTADSKVEQDISMGAEAFYAAVSAHAAATPAPPPATAPTPPTPPLPTTPAGVPRPGRIGRAGRAVGSLVSSPFRAGGRLRSHTKPILKVSGAVAVFALIIWGVVMLGLTALFEGDETPKEIAAAPTLPKAAPKPPTKGNADPMVVPPRPATVPASDQRLVMTCTNATGVLHSCDLEPAGCKGRRYGPSAHVYFDCPGGRWQSEMPTSDYPSGQVGIPLQWKPN